MVLVEDVLDTDGIKEGVCVGALVGRTEGYAVDGRWVGVDDGELDDGCLEGVSVGCENVGVFVDNVSAQHLTACVTEESNRS